ncbi:peptide chain release factor aRF-1 [Candidatus Bathyarchaeota archaeon]|nr:peptide chain release factor aRF-1 [Candidatus Bathyarchaeota archaeon]
MDRVRGKYSSVELYKLRKTLRLLASKEGRGTELVSLYVPSGRPISDVMNNLRQEYSTAMNIKSDRTRKNVQSALERVMQRLRLFKQGPPNGLIIFCGAIPQNGPGSERMETYVIVPPEPITIYYYGCGSKFYVEPLLEMLREKEVYGIILIDSSRATFATLAGNRLEVLQEITSGIPGKHRAGGQSARRFERLREMELNDFFRRAGKHIDSLFLNMDNLKGIIVGGPGPTKKDFLEGDYMNYVLKKKVLAVVDTAYADESGLRDIIDKVSDILKEVRRIEEKKLVQSFLDQVSKDTGLASYGEKDVKRHLEKGTVDVLLLSEDLQTQRVQIECSNCGYSEWVSAQPIDIPMLENELATLKCVNCGLQTLRVKDRLDLIDELIDMAENLGVRVEVISSKTEEGEMLLKSFGGVAAILKYSQ